VNSSVAEEENQDDPPEALSGEEAAEGAPFSGFGNAESGSDNEPTETVAVTAYDKIQAHEQKQPQKYQQRRARKNRFIDSEAEEGSDNELHDELVKHAGYSDEEGLHEEDLEELIDNTVMEVDDDQIMNKHINDAMIEDHMNIQRVIGGKFKER
jgi:hypothetical protein